MIDFVTPEVQKSTETLYTNLRGIFLQNLRNNEKLGLSLEDFILFYVLTILHPDLPVFIRDKYSPKMGRNKRILDFKSEILLDAEEFTCALTSVCQEDSIQVILFSYVIDHSQGSANCVSLFISEMSSVLPILYSFITCVQPQLIQN